MVQQSRPGGCCVPLILLLVTFGLCSAMSTTDSLQSTSTAALLKPKLEAAPARSMRTLRGISAATAATTATSTESCYTVCPTCVCARTEALNCCAKETAEGYAGCVRGSEMQLCKTHRAINACCR